MPNNQINVNRALCISVLLLATQLVACNSEDNLGGTGVDVDQGPGVVTTTPTADTPLALLAWVSPSERADNTPISLAEIAGYRIYYGSSQGEYTDQIEINDAYDNEVDTSELVLPAGRYYAVVTAVDSDGRESVYSDEVVLNI